MTRDQLYLFRILIGALVIGALLAQIVIVPQLGSEYADRYPEVAYLEPLYVPAVVIALGAFEVALLAAWQLLPSVGRDVARSSWSKRLTNVMAAFLVLMALIFAGIFVHAGSVASVGGPAMLFGLLASLAAMAGAVLLRSKAPAILLKSAGDRYSR